MIDSGKDNSRFLNHIIESIELINQYSSKMSKHDFYLKYLKKTPSDAKLVSSMKIFILI